MLEPDGTFLGFWFVLIVARVHGWAEEKQTFLIRSTFLSAQDCRYVFPGTLVFPANKRQRNVIRFYSRLTHEYKGIAMQGNKNQYFLLTETFPDPQENIGGQWRFILQQTGGPHRLEVSDLEPGFSGERLELLAVVRGLESIDGESHVTLVTSSRYVGHGIRFGLEQWRDLNWQWERFGEMTPIKNLDLWQRIDRALQYHSIECRVWRLKSKEFAKETIPVIAKPNCERPTNRLKRWLNLPVAAAQRFSQSRGLGQSACAAQ